MTRPVSTNPALPYPRGNTLNDLAGFDQDIVRALFTYLSELARRANEGLPEDGSEPMLGNLDMGDFSINNVNRIRLTSTSDASLASTLHAFQIGPTTGPNLIADSNEMMARDNGAISPLYLQADGGDLNIGTNTGANVNIGQNNQTVIHGAVGNAGIEHGRVDGVASTPYIDFHSGATAVDHDVRLLASGGTGANDGGTLNIDANGGVVLGYGKLQFPATQNPSTNVNTLDDYEEGTWTPTLTFLTPGDVNVVYTTRLGHYIKIGKMVTVWAIIQTSTFTHTTASGEMQLTGLPFTSVNLTSRQFTGSSEIDTFTFTGGRTQVNSNVTTNAAFVRFVASGTGVIRVSLNASEHASGTNSNMKVSVTYEAAS